MTRELWVAGIPRPQGSMRHVGRGRLVYSKTLYQWRDTVRTAAEAAGWEPFDRDVAARLVAMFYLPRPKSISVAKRPLPTRAPDLDKLVRACCDAITDSGAAWVDDSQVVEITATKRYAEAGGEGVHLYVTSQEPY